MVYCVLQYSLFYPNSQNEFFQVNESVKNFTDAHFDGLNITEAIGLHVFKNDDK